MASDEPRETVTEAARASRNTAPVRRSNGKIKKKSRNITKDPDLLLRVALATFLHDGKPSFRSAREVARELNLSVQATAVLQHKCFEEGILVPLLTLPQEVREVAPLEAAVKKYYGLKDVLLVPGFPAILEDLDQARRRGLHTAVIRAMSRRVAPYLDELLMSSGARQPAGMQDAKPFLLGVAWGRTMQRIAEYLLSNPRKVRLPALHVVPIIGITNTRNTRPVEANIVAMDIARAYAGQSAQLPCPAFVPALEASVVKQNQQVHDMLKTIQSCNAVITSMGPIIENADDTTDITLSNDESMNRELNQSARCAGAIGEICYWLFDRNGRQVTSTSYKAIGLDFGGLRHIAADEHRRVILVTGGDKRRFEPLKVALCARLANVLVSDTVTARQLLRS